MVEVTAGPELGGDINGFVPPGGPPPPNPPPTTGGSERERRGDGSSLNRSPFRVESKLANSAYLSPPVVLEEAGFEGWRVREEEEEEPRLEAPVNAPKSSAKCQITTP